MTWILIKDYDPRWPELFALEADRIRGLLGERALRVEHTGSTSVPGLVAKPIIDVLLVVKDSAKTRTSRISKLPATCCASASRSGLSIGCSKGQTRILICTCCPSAA